MITAVLIAATLPFVASIVISFGLSTKATDVGGYFLYDRNLDVDGFVKITIGYSLQVASIALFFYWTFNYGIIGPLLVCAAWGAGFFAIAAALKSGRLNEFLGSGRTDRDRSTPTIHGYIGSSVDAPAKSIRRSLAILSVALASIIGLGGTMMVEIDYSVAYFGQALGIPSLPLSSNLFMTSAILAFTVLYVLWGGYRSAVVTDRYQTPVAYVAFSVFILGVAAARASAGEPSGMGFPLVIYEAIIAILMWRRLRLVRLVSPEDGQSRLSTFFTFVPILLLGAAALLYVSSKSYVWDWSAIASTLAPEGVPALGFPFWGLVALLTVNSAWQLIDISSLQRLQSLNQTALLAAGHIPAVRILRAMGLEAGLGWALIILAAVTLRSCGLAADTFIPYLAASNLMFWLVPIFVFTVFVYMLSTISGFISALSYISFYDIVPILTGGSVPKINEMDLISKADDARHPRLTTIVVISFMFLFYVIMRYGVPGEQIAGVLYAIYAFQIAILPSAMLAIFSRGKISPLAVITSVAAGIGMAYLTAANPMGLRLAAWLAIDPVSWQVMPPLIAAIIASAVFALVGGWAWTRRKLRRS